MPLLGACKKKRYAQVEQPTGIDVPVRRLPDAPRVAGETSAGNEALLNVSVLVNGRPMAPWMSCAVVVYEQESNVSTRGKGECGKFVKFEPGTGDLAVTVSSGELQASLRQPTRTWVAGTQQLSVDLPWAIGRVRVKRVPHPAVASCRVSADGLSGDLEADWVVAKSGTYTLRFACLDTKGQSFSMDSKLEAINDSDNEVAVSITPQDDTRRTRIVPSVPGTEQPATPKSSEQFPVTKEYVEIPPTRGTDLPEPRGQMLPPPNTPPLPEPKGQDLPPSTRVNP